METIRCGRPKKVYKHCADWFSRSGTFDWLEPGSRGPADLVRPGSLTKDIVDATAVMILQLEVPVLRRVLQTIMVFTHGYSPESVSKAIDKLRQDNTKIDHRFIELCGSLNSLFTYGRKPKIGELKELTDLYERREKILTKEILKTVGERFIRSALIASDAYSGITQEERLGLVAHKGKHSLDMLATSKSTGLSYGISVKNQNAWLNGDLKKGGKAIADAWTKANAHGVVPWLFVPWVTEEGRKRCAQLHVRVTAIGRQIVPKKTLDGYRMESVIEKLRPVIGPQPYFYFSSRLARVNDMDIRLKPLLKYLITKSQESIL